MCVRSRSLGWEVMPRILELAACDEESSAILLVLLASFNPPNSKQKRRYLCVDYWSL